MLNQPGPITINASRIGRNGGLRTFTQALLSALPAGEDVSVIVPGQIEAPAQMRVVSLPGFLGSSSRLSVMKPLLWWLYSALLFPAPRTARILSTTHHVLPFRRRQIVTVHDLRPYFLPDTVMQRIYFRWILPRALRRCDGVLTVSETSKQLLIEHYRLPESSIHVIPNAINERFFDHASASSDVMGEKPPYLLLVGCSWKHKNGREVLEMHTTWSDRYRLKILAGPGQYRTSLMRLVDKLGLQAKVDFLDNVTESDLLTLYRGCAALVYPSLMEGFGLPPLEAMACGRPVIVSDIPVFRELYGDVPVYVQLGSNASWHRAFGDLQTPGSIDRLNARVRKAQRYSSAVMRDRLSAALETFSSLYCDSGTPQVSQKVSSETA